MNIFKRNKSKPTSIQPNANTFPKAIAVTQMGELHNFYGKFVKLEIDELRNPDTFRLRRFDQLFPVSEEEINAILARPLTRLQVTTIRSTTHIVIEPISTIAAKSYEDNHYIYGILRRRQSRDYALADYVLTNAFIDSTEHNLHTIAQALDSQGLFDYIQLSDCKASIFNFSSDPVEHLEIPTIIDKKRVTAISKQAFYGNNTIKTLKIPITVKTIEYGAFSCCNALESVFLGDGVETIEGAFDVCKELKHVHIGKSVSLIDTSFTNCHKLNSFMVDPDNKHFCSIDGVLFSKDKTVLIFCPCGKKGKYIVPEGTKIIGKQAFENTDLSEIVIANTVETIEDDAFAWARGIKRLYIPSSVKKIPYDAINAGVGDFEGEIIVEEGSFAQQYFKRYYDDGEYNIVVTDNHHAVDTIKAPAVDTIETPAVDTIDRLFCRRCGTQLPLDSAFCFKCGTKVETEVL